jgi:peptide/nickel transport system substrate-binding protein
MLMCVALAGVCASGCTRQATPPAPPVTMRIGVGVPEGSSERLGLSFILSAMTTEAWLTSQVDGRQSERIAKDWSWNEAQTRLSLKLRQDIFFHDGTKLTPEIAAQALRTSIKKHDAFSFSSIASVEPSGPDSVDLILSEPNSFLLPDLALTSLRMPDHPEIGTGPFQVVPAEGKTVLRAFDKYFRGRPALSGIDIFTYPTQRKAWTALMRGDVDMLQEVSRDAADFVEAESTVKTYTFRRSYYIPLVFNVRHPILKNVAVRTAINEAVDKAVLIHDGLSGRGRPADGPIWPEHWAYSPAPQPFSFNPEAARLRLDRAGFRERRETAGGIPARFSFTCLVFGDDTRFERLAVLLQKQLADVGIDMKLQSVKMEDLQVRLKKGDFDAFVFEFAGRSLSWVYEFWHSRKDGFIDTGYTSADAVLDRVRGARSNDEVRSGIAELARVLHDDPPAAFMAWQEQSRAVSTKFDLSAEPARDILNNVWQWRPASPVKQASR